MLERAEKVPRISPMRGAVGPAEGRARVDLATRCRLVAHHGMADMMANHVSARVPDEDDAFLIDPHGMMQGEITAASCFGLVAPARTPPAVVAEVNAGVVAVLCRPGIERLMVEQGADPVGDTPEQFADYLDSEIRRWSAIVRASGASVD